jgi:hypothetical protein
MPDTIMQFHAELKFFPEGPDLRVRSKGLNYLFADIAEKEFGALYDKSAAFVRKHFRKASIIGLHKNLDEEAYLLFTRTITLDWMYYYNVNGFKIKLTRSDLTHPETYEIAMRLSEKLSRSAARSHRIAASILGIRVKNYEKWLRGYLQWVNAM